MFGEHVPSYAVFNLSPFWGKVGMFGEHVPSYRKFRAFSYTPRVQTRFQVFGGPLPGLQGVVSLRMVGGVSAFLSQIANIGGDRKSNYQNDSLKDTAKEVSKEYSVSYATVFRDAEFSRAVDKIAKEIGEEAKHAILTGRANVPKKDVEKLIEVKEKAPGKNVH